MTAMEKTQLIARGRTAEVYAWEPGSILKLFYDWVPAEWIEREAWVAGKLADSPVATARLLDRVEQNGRPGLVFEKLEGPSMLAIMSARPWLLGREAALFAGTHFSIHRQSGEGLAQVRTSIRRSISQVEVLPSAIRAYALEVLDSLPDGAALLHYDFHPDQILLAATGPKVLDWMTACQGDPMADVARTSVILTIGGIPHHLSFMTRAITNAARGAFHARYIAAYLRLNRNADRETIRRWMIPVAAARLNERIPGDTEKILAFLQESMVRHPHDQAPLPATIKRRG